MYCAKSTHPYTHTHSNPHHQYPTQPLPPTHPLVYNRLNVVIPEEWLNTTTTTIPTPSPIPIHNPTSALPLSSLQPPLVYTPTATPTPPLPTLTDHRLNVIYAKGEVECSMRTSTHYNHTHTHTPPSLYPPPKSTPPTQLSLPLHRLD